MSNAYVLHFTTISGEQSAEFADWDDARDYAEANVSPEHNGQTIPNTTFAVPSYETHDIDSLMWAGNKYAYIVRAI